MSLTLNFKTENETLTVTLPDGTTITTPLDALPTRAQSLTHSFNYTENHKLFIALGGENLLRLLQAERAPTLYFNIQSGDPADALAWECAIISGKTFLVHRFAVLRRVDQTVSLDDTPGPLRLVALGADALVDKAGHPVPDHRQLDILGEMRRIERVLNECNKVVKGVRVAPTSDALAEALNDGQRTLLYLSCHGSIKSMDDGSLCKPLVSSGGECWGLPFYLWRCCLV